MEVLPRDKFGPLLHTTLLALSAEQWEAYYVQPVEAQVAGLAGT